MKSITYTEKTFCENLSISRVIFDEMVRKDMNDSIVNKVSTFFSDEFAKIGKCNMNTLSKISDLMSQIVMNEGNDEYYERIDYKYVAKAEVGQSTIVFSIIEVNMIVE